jgi:hypothetical protein
MYPKPAPPPEPLPPDPPPAPATPPVAVVKAPIDVEDVLTACPLLDRRTRR